MTEPIYAIGDIHGQLEMLERALSRIEDDGGADAPIVVLGDLVDRGPDSRGVIELLSGGIADGRNWIVLMGNHDRMFIDFLDSGLVDNPNLNTQLTWLSRNMGGAATLASYGVDPAAGDVAEAARKAVPQSHREFLASRPLYHQHGDLLFVHAGIYPGTPLDQQYEDELIWIREPFLSWTEPHPWLVVHGHTAQLEPEHCGNRVNLDGGAGYNRALCAAVFEGRDAWLLKATGRVPLLPPAGDAMTQSRP